MMRIAALVLVLAACGHSAPPPPAPAQPTSAAPAHAPQLFTLEQLRAGNPAGRVLELRIEVAGAPTTIQHWEFTKADATGATIHSVTRDEAGAIVADETGTSTWEELHAHGQFPSAATTIQDGVSITVPAGTFTTRVYTVKDQGVTQTVWFAVDLPGPPVQFTTEKDGKVVMRAVMLRAR